MYAKAQKWEPKWLFKGGGNWDRGCLVERLRLDRSPGIRVQRGLQFKSSKDSDHTPIRFKWACSCERKSHQIFGTYSGGN